MGEVISLTDFRNKAAQAPAPAVVAKANAQPEGLTPVVSDELVKKANGVEVFDYAKLMKRSMWQLIKAVLGEVVEGGLPKNSVLYITFDTTNPGVEMSSHLKAKYANKITIMLDAWWEDLVVNDAGFTITLNFGNVRERMTVPFDAVITFVDPSVEFGLRFDVTEEDNFDPVPPAPLIA